MTKAPTLAERINAGKLVDNEPIEVVLTDANGTEEWWNTDNGTVRVIADGDGKHFLLGNPYMYPLDIARFLKGNETILAQNIGHWIRRLERVLLSVRLMWHGKMEILMLFPEPLSPPCRPSL